MSKLPVAGSRKAVRLAVLAAILLAGLAVAQPGWTAPNPPGNNGTVKIDGVPFDDAPDNEPHVGCTFQVDFYGYDEGDLFADVTFESHPPTGPVVTLLTDTVFIGEDDNSGGGSEAGLDASVTYTLDFDGIEPHPNQGFHVKLTVNAEGSQGADVKHKVFWVTGCVPSPTTTTTSGTTTSTSGTTTTTVGATSSSGATSTSGETSSSGATTTTAAVGGASSTAPGGGASPGGGVLPFTGGPTLPMLLAAVALLGVGAAGLLTGSRWRRRARAGM
jgi:hypothetical protein